MAAQRQYQPQPEMARPALRLLVPNSAQSPEVLRALDTAFGQGMRWGVAIATLGVWVPVATALIVWLS